MDRTDRRRAGNRRRRHRSHRRHRVGLVDSIGPADFKVGQHTIVQDSKCSSDDVVGSAEICIKVSTAQTPCYGDSGGPALVNGLLVGADSRGGNVCGDAGGEIYSDVTSHLSWITQKTGVRPAA